MSFKKLRSTLNQLIRPLLAVVLLFFLFKSGLIKIEQLKEVLSNYKIICLGLTLLSLQFLLFTLRWKLILNFTQRFNFLLLVKYQLIAQFFNIFIPGGVGGDFVKAYELSKKEKISKTATMTSVFLDRILGLYSMILFSALFLIIEKDSVSQKYVTISSTLLISSSIGLLFSKPVLGLMTQLVGRVKSELIQKFLHFFTNFSNALSLVKNKNSLFKIIGVSFWAQVFSISFLYYTVSQLVPTPPSYFIFFPLACFAFMMSSIPITPGGIGFGQAAFYFIFKDINIQTANAVVIGITLLQLYNILISLPGAYFFTRISKKTSTDLN